MPHKFKKFFRSMSLVPVAIVLPSCSEKTSQASLSVTVTSCQYEESKQCFEYFTPAATDVGYQACMETSGSWNKSQGCAAEGRVQGCKGVVNGAKAYVFWSYDATDGAAIVQAFCERGGMYAITGATVSVVNP